jgi:hypothetical protein
MLMEDALSRSKNDMRDDCAEVTCPLGGTMLVWDTNRCPCGASRDGVPRLHAPIDHPDHEDHEDYREMVNGVRTIVVGTAGTGTIVARTNNDDAGVSS